MSEANIYQRINMVRSDCDYLQKKKADKGVGILYDEVMAMLRGLLIKHGIVMVMRQKSLEMVGGVGQNQKIYQGEFELDLVNMDDPKDFVTHTSFAQGMDGGDKGPGKAHTYAAKQMLVKAFNIETGIDEESRSEKLEKIQQQEEMTRVAITDDRLEKAIKSINAGEFTTEKLHKAFKLNNDQVERLRAGLV